MRAESVDALALEPSLEDLGPSDRVGVAGVGERKDTAIDCIPFHDPQTMDCAPQRGLYFRYAAATQAAGFSGDRL